MKEYNVNFHYTIQVEAENEIEAEKLAVEDYNEISPKLSKMSIDVEER